MSDTTKTKVIDFFENNPDPDGGAAAAPSEWDEYVEDVQNAVIRVKAGDPEAMNELLTLMMPQVRRLSRRVAAMGIGERRGTETPIDDMVQEGLLAAMKAVDGYDPETYDAPFALYTHKAVVYAMRHAIRHDAMIPVPQHYREAFYEALDKLREAGKPVTPANLKAELPHISEAAIFGIYTVLKGGWLRLDELAYDDSDTEWHSIVCQSGWTSIYRPVEAAAETRLDRVDLEQTVVGEFNQQHWDVVVMRYGLHGDLPKPVAKVAKAVMLPETAVQWILNRVTRYLKQVLEPPIRHNRPAQAPKLAKPRRKRLGRRAATPRSKVGYRGVSKLPSGRYRARIAQPFTNSTTSLGIYDTPEEAALAYNEAARAQYGLEAVLNDIPVNWRELRERSELHPPNPGGKRFRGVTATHGGRFQARIMVDGRAMRLGSYETAEEAARAYDEVALKYRGVEAKLNFPEPAKAA
jgi:RNA polymerase sigma factor (sigma-70 family)